ncbi:long-chain fatty acid--CoA ligase [Olivibacter sp. SDN3]|uniref:AMP-dependent synthetase/ligase n=1 Tax=Olivibacter sp. SDN3 TaxID=2764720 RepID=UPI0016510052|nr:long-chain fatty acid--CoA ligase [Olivibacter sp. SDN3]QNL50089.1 long-chain fatty acid--CoA ligase [Olivibacter sp. SDN3]
MESVKRVFDLLEYYQQHHAQKVMVAGKANGKWTTYDTKSVLEIINNLSKGLLDLGIKKGDKVAMMSANRPEWNFVDFAVNQIGAAIVPLYPTLSESDLDYIIEDAEVKMTFVGTKELYDKINKSLQNKDIGVPVYVFDEIDGSSNWKEIEEKGRDLDVDLHPYRDAVSEDDLLTLIYTSGTTGKPKGVHLSHRNLVSNFSDCGHLLPANYLKAISFLPLSHIFERMVVYLYYYKGISIYYAESMDTIVADINDVKPNGFTTVPRVLEKVYDKIVAKGAALTGIKRKLFFWALDLGLGFQEPGKNGFFYRIKLAIARKLIFKKWREALGGNIVAIISGGAALQERLARIFWGAGIPVLEGYGLTETSPVIAVNNLEINGLMFGSVGKLLKSVQVKIAADGEILCKGPNVTKGYYKNDEATAEIFDSEGYFKTGDIGELTKDGFLRITDRKKEMFKTTGGKYVAPQVLENKFMESTLIAQVMVVGEGKKFPSALIVPSFDDLKKWAEKKGITGNSKEELVANKEVLNKFQGVVDRANSDFGHWEQVKKFTLLSKEWSIDEGELTPKLSLKRKVILEKNKEIIEEIYKEEDTVKASDDD